MENEEKAIKKPVIDIFKITELCVYGKDILRIRYSNGFSRRKVCVSMEKHGYVYYPVKLLRYERQVKVCLSASEMRCLITAIGAVFNVIS